MARRAFFLKIYWKEYKDQEIPSAYRLAWSNIFMSKQEGELMVSLVRETFPIVDD